MSRHWKPDGEIARIVPAKERARKQWPHGATAGLMLVAAACVGLAVVVYQVAGPRSIVEEEASESPNP